MRERDEARNHLTAAQRQLDEQQETIGRIAALYNGFVNGKPRPDFAADQVLAAIGDVLGPPFGDPGPLPKAKGKRLVRPGS